MSQNEITCNFFTTTSISIKFSQSDKLKKIHENIEKKSVKHQSAEADNNDDNIR